MIALPSNVLITFRLIGKLKFPDVVNGFADTGYVFPRKLEYQPNWA